MLSKYGILYSKYLEEYKPITYQELIMNGTINDFLELKKGAKKTMLKIVVADDNKFLLEHIVNELKNRYKKPSTDSFIEQTEYNYFIYNKADEIVIWTSCPKSI